MKPSFTSTNVVNFTSYTAVKTKTVAIIVYPGVEIIDVTGPMEVFAFANHLRKGDVKEPAYNLMLLAAQAGPLKASCGLQIIADKSYNDVDEDIDTLLIAGTIEIDYLLTDPGLQTWLIKIAPKVRRIVSVCTGAFLLAETGLLDGLRATSHWLSCNRLATCYPAIKVEPDRIFVRDGRIATSGGITSGIDLALSLVEEDLGSELALIIARFLVVFLKRPGGQSQFSAYLTSEAHQPEIKDLQAWIMTHLTEDLRIEALAERLCMSPRNFARFFVAEAGITPAKFVELARIDAARHYLASTQLTIEAIAEKAGFGDSERMRRAFTRQLGVNPQNYRERFSGAEVYPVSA